MNSEDILNSGKLYKVGQVSDGEGNYNEYLQNMEDYNAAGYTSEGLQKKKLILKKNFAEVGEDTYIQAPYHAMWGGKHVYLGKNVYINFNCTLIDDANIYIGEKTMIAPNVTIISASHPISPKLRSEGYGCNQPVHIGKNVWLAANVTVLPGVHIGDNSVVGAGSVVTKDIPSNVLAIGTPAKVLREIGPDDDIYYNHGKLISENLV
ncbi:sugar O-acetyltransferase [Companilactobacillus zhachilii]|uniref:sugar O-acetyltransferase n=1 Tax=Companilactobacillus zhachilii TaxID=2304606 RepID=UPI001923FAB1|nr:sugar O-acetyltransferase [Companilactobacillus zhachilii]MBL3530368.1 sugar O-acetyltransferase [Companilactobacillus zhachilii]